MLCMGKIDVEKLKVHTVVEVKTYLKGTLRKLVLADLEKGEKQADILRRGLQLFYEERERRAKHGY
jgi:hypothetical protein